MFNGQGNFSTRFLVGSFEGFWATSSAAERKFEGFAGSLKVAGVSSLLSTREERKLLHQNPVEAELVETQKEQKAPRIPATFENQQKIPGQVSSSSS
jgi:hypothetical protein